LSLLPVLSLLRLRLPLLGLGVALGQRGLGLGRLVGAWLGRTRMLELRIPRWLRPRRIPRRRRLPRRLWRTSLVSGDDRSDAACGASRRCAAGRDDPGTA